VGQEKAERRTMLEVRRWVEKLKKRQQMMKQGIDPSGMLKEQPGPYVLFISEPGTGKSLLIKILAEEMEVLYATAGMLFSSDGKIQCEYCKAEVPSKEVRSCSECGKSFGIELTDVLTIKNKVDENRPLIRQVPAGVGQRVVEQAERTALREKKDKQQLIFTFLMIAIVMGGALLGTGLFILGVVTMQVGIVAAWFSYTSAWLGWFITGVPLLVFPMFIMVMWGGQNLFSFNQTALLDVPHLIVNNGPGRKLVINATVANSSSLMGSIDWNALGNTPGMSTPLHRRVVSGDIHKGSDKLVFMDEIKNLQPHIAIELLSVMEDGEAPIRSRAGGGLGNTESTSNMSIATQDPVPANFMLIAAGNMDVLFDPHSIINTVTAFRDRFNYGDIIYFDTHMDATPINEMKVAQVITDEIYRFGLLPMHKDGIRRIIEHMRSRADNNKRLRTMWRYAIKVVLKSYELVLERGGEQVVSGEDVDRAIREFCSPIEQQALEEKMDNSRDFKLIRNEGTEEGMVNGLAVVGNPHEGRSAGTAFPVAVVCLPKAEGMRRETFFVTGVLKDQQSWVQDSILHVRTAIFKMYGIDPAMDRYTHISFAQHGGKDNFVEGPSAGVTMTLALMSILGDPRLPPEQRKPVPIRLDVGVTGTIELIPDPKNPKNVRVGSIGGVPDKVNGAAKHGLKYVIVPMENYLHTLTNENYPCKIFGAESILAYFDLIRGDVNVIETLLKGSKSDSDEEIAAWREQKVQRRKVVIPYTGSGT
jgi:lon-related putative ATP-dependent protease